MAWQRDKQKEGVWRRLTREQARSGLSVRDFCEARRLVESSFYFWRRELRRREKEQDAIETKTTSAIRRAPAPSFAAVTVAGLESLSSALEIVLTSGVRVRVPSGFDRQTLHELLSVLESTAC